MTAMNKIHFSKMTGKLDGLQAVSTNTVTNDFCKKRYEEAKVKNEKAGKVVDICGVCYSQTMLATYRKNMQNALQRNSDLLSTTILPYEDLDNLLVAFLRIDAHGELINETHLINIVNLAKKNPHCAIALWTKRTDLVKPFFSKNEKPANLILIYSNPKVGTIMAKPPRFFDRTFNNVLEDEHVEKQNCTGQKCKDCMLCYTLNNGVDTIVEKVKKY